MCGYGTTYTLVTPRMAWVEGIVGEDVTPCFATDGAWDPNDACTPFPTQLDQPIGTWAEGCAGELGGEPQCGELGSGTGSESGSGSDGSTAGGESSSGPDPGTESGPPPGTSTENPPDPPTTSPVPATSGTDASDTDDPGAGGEGDGCGCRHDGKHPPLALAIALLMLLSRPRRRPE